MKHRRNLRDRCRRLVDDLDLPDPFDVEKLVRHVAEQVGKPIQLIPMPMQHIPCGLLVNTRDTHLLFYESRTSGAHQDLIVCHELAHLLCGHYSTTAVSDAITPSLTLPDLDPALVASALARTSYTKDDEREAETVATLLIRRAYRASAESTPHRPLSPNDANAIEHLRRSFGHPDRYR